MPNRALEGPDGRQAGRRICASRPLERIRIHPPYLEPRLAAFEAGRRDTSRGVAGARRWSPPEARLERGVGASKLWCQKSPSSTCAQKVMWVEVR